MSLSFEYFFNWPGQTLEGAVRRFNHELGFRFIHYNHGPDQYICRLLGIDWTLQSNEMLSAPPNLDFEAYQYILDCNTTASDSISRPLQLTLMVSMAFGLTSMFGIDGLLTLDTQILLARYGSERLPGRWDVIDMISGKRCFLPSEVSEIASRVPTRFLQSD